MLRLHDAARTLGRELLIEIIAGKNGSVGDDTIARVLSRLYEIGIRPDWWKLEGQASDAAWNAIGAAIEAGDPLCRGVMLLGLEAPEDELARSFAIARKHPHVKGFAVGRTIFVEPAQAWFAGAIDDAAAVTAMADAFSRLCELWSRAGDT